MDNLKKIILLVFILFGISNSYARKRIPFGKKEVITVAAELPDNENYVPEEGSNVYLDLATLHEEFNVAWFLPLWITKEPKLVLYDAKGEIYYDLPDDVLNSILEENKIKKEDVLKVPFYNKYGGKLILIVILGFIVWSYIKKDKEEEEEKNDE